MKTLYGVFGAVGRWSNWQRFFNPSRVGVAQSFAALLLCFPALWLVMVGLETQRAQLAGMDVPNFRIAPFVLIIGLWIMSFPITSALVAILMDRTDRLPLWWTARNWAVTWLCGALGIIFAGVVYLNVPTSVGYGALLAAYLGLLPIDIRLAQRAGNFAFGAAVLPR